MTERIMLTVRLTRADDGYALRYLGRTGLTDAQPPTETRVGLDSRLTKAADALAAGDLGGLAEVLTGAGRAEVGNALYDLLFPAEATNHALFKELSGSKAEDVGPWRRALRLRVDCDERLQALPWRLIAHQGRSLAVGRDAWTMEIAAGGHPVSPVCPRPARTVIVAPRNAPEEIQTHIRWIRGLLEQREPAYEGDTFLTVVESRSELKDELEHRPPQILYYCGHARVKRGAPALVLDDDRGGTDDVLAEDLLAWFGRPPLAVFLNGCGTGAGGWNALSQRLTRDVPAVLANLTTAWALPAADIGQAWLSGVLLQGKSPVEAIHHVPDGARLDEPYWWTTVVHASYDGWSKSVTPAPGARRDGRPISHRLDRFNQRAVLRARVDQLLHDGRAVLAVVGLGGREDGNHVGELGRLLEEDLRAERADQLVLFRIEVDFPSYREHLHRGLEAAIRQTLGASPHAALVDFIQHAAPDSDPGIKPVIWLDFGTFGPKHRPALTLPQVEEWLAVCQRVVAASCPQTVRVIAFLCCDAKSPAQVARKVAEHDSNDPRFICKALPVLKHVDYDELSELMKTPGATECPPARLTEAIGRLFDACIEPGGETANYAKLCLEIDYADEIGWLKYLDAGSGETKGGSEEEA